MRNTGAHQDDISPRQQYHLRPAGGAAAWVAAAALDAVAAVHLRRPPRESHPLARRWYCSLIIVVMSQVPALAQGCASCYTTTAAGGSQTIHALRSGILVLLVPPVVLFLGIMFLLLRWRRVRSASTGPITGIGGAE